MSAVQISNKTEEPINNEFIAIEDQPKRTIKASKNLKAMRKKAAKL